MSRIGKAPIEIPANVDVVIDGNTVTVKGPQGQLTQTFRPEIELVREGSVINVTRKSDDRQSRSLHGLTRTLLNNMIVGAGKGFTKNLEMVGVGYRAQVQGNTLVMQLGYSHPIEVVPPPDIKITVEQNTKITVSGPNKQTVGDVAADIRSYRKPEPYKGKGVRYAGEYVRRKAGKSGKK